MKRNDESRNASMGQLAGDLGLFGISFVLSLIGVFTLKVGAADGSAARHVGAALIVANTVLLPLWTWFRLKRLDEMQARIETQGLLLGVGFALIYAVLRFTYGAWSGEPVDGELLPFLPSLVLLYSALGKFHQRARLARADEDESSA